VQLAFLEQLLIPNAHSSISTHVPAAVSWYPAIQVHTEESALVIVQIAPLPQLHSRTAVVVDGILDDVKDGDKVDEITCDTEILAFCGAVALAFGSGEAVAFRGTPVLSFGGEDPVAFCCAAVVAFCREAVVVTWAYVKRYAITLLQTVTAEEDNIWRVEQY
jgi:hypothetical protein